MSHKTKETVIANVEDLLGIDNISVESIDADTVRLSVDIGADQFSVQLGRILPITTLIEDIFTQSGTGLTANGLQDSVLETDTTGLGWQPDALFGNDDIDLDLDNDYAFIDGGAAARSNQLNLAPPDLTVTRIVHEHPNSSGSTQAVQVFWIDTDGPPDAFQITLQYDGVGNADITISEIVDGAGGSLATSASFAVPFDTDHTFKVTVDGQDVTAEIEEIGGSSVQATAVTVTPSAVDIFVLDVSKNSVNGPKLKSVKITDG